MNMNLINDRNQNLNQSNFDQVVAYPYQQSPMPYNNTNGLPTYDSLEPSNPPPYSSLMINNQKPNNFSPIRTEQVFKSNKRKLKINKVNSTSLTPVIIDSAIMQCTLNRNSDLKNTNFY